MTMEEATQRSVSRVQGRCGWFGKNGKAAARRAQSHPAYKPKKRGSSSNILPTIVEKENRWGDESDRRDSLSPRKPDRMPSVTNDQAPPVLDMDLDSSTTSF